MKRIFFYECRRVFSKKLLLTVLAVMVTVSLIAALWGDFTSTVQRRQFYDLVAELSTNEEKVSALQDEYARLTSLRSTLNEEFNAGAGYVDTSLPDSVTGDVYNEFWLYADLLPEIENLAGYEAYLDSIGQNAAQMGALSLFEDANSFESRVIAQTPGAYKHLRGTQVKIEFPDGAQGAIRGVFPWIGLVFAVIFAAALFSEEIEDGSARLIRAAKYGRKTLLTIRLFVLLLTALLTALLLVGIPVAVNFFRWGLGDLNRPIQSLPAFFTSPLKVSVGGYFLLQAGALAASIFLTELITVLFCNLLGGSLAVYAGMLGTLSVETLCYFLISRNSFLNPLKYLNLIALGDAQKLLSDYRALNFFGQPVSLQTVLLLTILLVLAVIVPILYRLSFTREPVRLSLPKFLQREKNYHFSLFPKEAYRLFITQKAALVLAVLVGIQWYMYASFAPAFNQEDMRLRSYVTAINGRLDEAGLAYLSEQEASYDSLEETLVRYAQKFEDGEISEESYQAISQAMGQQMQSRQSFLAFKEEAEQLLSEGKTVFLYKTGYELILGKPGAKTVAMQGVLAMVFLTLALAAIYAADNASGFAALLFSTPRGRGYLLRRKLVLAAIVAVFTSLLAYIPYMMNILKFYGTFQLGESVQLLLDFPLDISLLSFIILVMVLRALLCTLAGAAVTLVSRKSPNVRVALTVSLLMTVLPAELGWVVA